MPEAESNVLIGSVIYKKALPIVISIVGSIYCITFLVRFILWCIEPYQNKQFKSKCRKLEKFFQQRLEKLERPLEIYQPSFRIRHVSLETLPVDSNDNNNNNNNNNNQQRPQINRSHSKHYLELWRWCVAMGHLKYEHGERLNLIISELEDRYKENVV